MAVYLKNAQLMFRYDPKPFKIPVLHPQKCQCSASCLIKENTDVCLCAYLFLCTNDCLLHSVHMLIYTEVVDSSRLYT